MILNPILKVLSTFSKHRVRCLLIGGQGCIIYGASEFSRDSDFVILSSTDNLRNLRAALRELNGRRIYVPPLEKRYLDRGHACHFRCHASGVEQIRVDILSRLRGCDDFPFLWNRRFELNVTSGPKINVIGLRDLVASKKTQRDKDWFMLQRLVDNDIALHENTSDIDKIKWWLSECRSPNSLINLCERYPGIVKQQVLIRSLLKTAIRGDEKKLSRLLEDEKAKEQEKDKAYWKPLRKELESLRRRKVCRTRKSRKSKLFP